MKTTHKIAYDYCMAMTTQRAGEDMVTRALGSLGSDNSIFSLSEPIEGAYTKLVEELLGPELWDWLMWWMWETDCGTVEMKFAVDDVWYDPSEMTLYKFLEVVDDAS